VTVSRSAAVFSPPVVLDVACDDWDPLESYGQLAWGLVGGLESRHGATINVVGGHRRPTADLADRSLRDRAAIAPRPASGSILLGYPPLYHTLGNSLAAATRIAVTMFESSELPSGWVDVLNRLKAVVVPSSWLETVFRDAGVTAALHRVPLGIKECYVPTHRPAGRSPFTFLTVATPYPRKGWDIAVRAFDAAFGRSVDHRLIIKMRAGWRLPVRIVHPRVEILAENLDDCGMVELYRSVDAFVFPSRGEGFGLPPREAAATGLPVVATNWGGTADDIENWGWPLRSSPVKAWYGHTLHAGLGTWAEPDVLHLAELMRMIAAGGAVVQSRAMENAERVRRLYPNHSLVDGVWRIWSQISAARGGSGS